MVRVGGEVVMRSYMCLEVGRCGYMGVLLFYIMSMITVPIINLGAKRG